MTMTQDQWDASRARLLKAIQAEVGREGGDAEATMALQLWQVHVAAKTEEQFEQDVRGTRVMRANYACTTQQGGPYGRPKARRAV